MHWTASPCHRAPLAGALAPAAPWLQLPAVLQGSEQWGQLVMCVPWHALDALAQRSSEGAAPRAAAASCPVVPLFHSRGPAYHHPLGTVMRATYLAGLEEQRQGQQGAGEGLGLVQAAELWGRTAAGVVGRALTL